LQSLEQDLNRDLFENVKSALVEYPAIDPNDPKVEEIVSEFVENFQDQPYRLHVGKDEVLYPRAVVDVLEEGNPLYVTNLNFPLLKKFELGKNPLPSTVYQLNGALLNRWFWENYELIINDEPYDYPPTHIIEDDPIIISEVMDGGYDVFVIATDDVRLYRLAMNKAPDTWVFRISCIHYLQANTWCKDMELSIDDEMLSAFKREYKSESLSVKVLVDNGSVESYLNKYVDEPETGTYWQTVGIPWRKDVHKRSLEKKPHHGFLTTPRSMSLRDLRMPRSLYDNETHRLLKRSIG